MKIFTQRNGKYRIMAEMNMSPLIDVALVLLIIFMVMTPFLIKSQIKINLPKAKLKEAVPRPEQILQIQVDTAGNVFIDGQTVAKDTLESRLRARLPDPQNQPVMIEADQDVKFQHVVTVMDAVKRTGVSKLGINVRHVPADRQDTGRGQTKKK
ncbi:MAG: biopolymer transporter ExbD [Kiritimatiellia bacterium]|nr:biopolymer transporter ExbD [Kiritimatiellia bacterium]